MNPDVGLQAAVSNDRNMVGRKMACLPLACSFRGCALPTSIHQHRRWFGRTSRREVIQRETQHLQRTELSRMAKFGTSIDGRVGAPLAYLVPGQQVFSVVIHQVIGVIEVGMHLV